LKFARAVFRKDESFVVSCGVNRVGSGQRWAEVGRGGQRWAEVGRVVQISLKTLKYYFYLYDYSHILKEGLPFL
jgi:hypothetical protein